MRDRIIVEYALRYTDKPIGFAEYYIVRRLLKTLKGELPTSEQIEKTSERAMDEGGWLANHVLFAVRRP